MEEEEEKEKEDEKQEEGNEEKEEEVLPLQECGEEGLQGGLVHLGIGILELLQQQKRQELPTSSCGELGPKV